MQQRPEAARGSPICRLSLPAHGGRNGCHGRRGDGNRDPGILISLSACSDELNDRFLLAIAYYWKGRCMRRRGEYDEALIYTGKGRDLALGLDHPRMAAVMQVLEGWILFQQGKWKDAVRVSQVAENALRQTDDYVTLGNIQSFYGRMARREGRFDKAIEFFESAIAHYKQARSAATRIWRARWPTWLWPSAESLCNCRRESIAMPSAGARVPASQKRQMPARSSHDYRSRLTQLRREALEHLDSGPGHLQAAPKSSRRWYGISERRLYSSRQRRLSTRRSRGRVGLRGC